MKKILGIGNALVDIITFLENDDVLKKFSLPLGSMQLIDAETAISLEEATQSCKKHRTSGGSAANTIHGLARLGVTTGYIGKVGRDDTGNFFRDDMIQVGIKPHLSDSPSNTGRSQALVTPGGERTMATYLGAAVELSAQQISHQLFAAYDHLHLEGYLVLNQELMESALEITKQCGMTASIDLASYNVVEANLDFLKKIIARYKPVIFANEEEARAFTGLSDPHRSLDVLSSLSNTAIVKIGAKGSLICHEKRKYAVSSIPVDCIDTTGAGDLYAAGYLFGYVNDLAPGKCGRIGSLLAGKVIEEAGAKISQASWEGIHKILLRI